MKRLLLVLSLLLPCTAQAQILNNPVSGVFATALTRGDHGDWWLGADDEGLFHRTSTGNWVDHIGWNEIGDHNITSITVDKAHRVWVGTASGGVAVYDQPSVKWKRYTVWNGPLSNRINDLQVDASGAVWGATDSGLFRWNEKSGWQYPGVFATNATTRTSARKPVYALAIESPTSVLEATDDGLNRISLVNGEPHIESIGRATSRIQPAHAKGGGFLPGPVHDVALDSRNNIWCATRYGICISKDAGTTWQFLRGADWQANVIGSAVPLTPDTTPTNDDLLAEDWVNTLAPTADDKMWLGFRQKGAEERDCRTLELIVSTGDDPKFATAASFMGDWVNAIVPLGGDNALIARYGGGLGSLFGTTLAPPAQKPAWPSADFPEDAKFPLPLLTDLAHALDTRTPLKVGEGAFYNLDRETRGDWPLRYGNEAAQLMGMHDGRFNCDAFSLDVNTGPHRAGTDDDCFTYTHWLTSDNPNVVQMPVTNTRRQSEINDGTWQGDKYPYYFDGPDLFASFSVPEGLHRVSFYWFNKDAHSGDNRMRDHRVELFPGDLTPTQCLTREPLAKARFWNGWNGEYASFAVRGPAKYQVRIARDRSHGTILQAVLFDRLGTPQSKRRQIPDRIQMPVAPPIQDPANPVATLWNTCNQAELRGVPCSLERTIALRAAKDTNAPENLMAAWRVQAALWDENGADRRVVSMNPNLVARGNTNLAAQIGLAMQGQDNITTPRNPDDTTATDRTYHDGDIIHLWDTFPPSQQPTFFPRSTRDLNPLPK